MGKLTFKIDGEVHEHWLKASLSKSLDTAANSFELTLAGLHDDKYKRIAMRRGKACEIYLDGKKQLTGYLDQLSTSFSQDSRGANAAGRSKVGDLIDCSNVAQEFLNVDLLELSQALAEPFGISVSSDVSVGEKVEQRIVGDGESYYSVIEEFARVRALRLISTPNGNVKFVRLTSTPAKAVLKVGGNIKSGRANFIMNNRFSTYIAYSQDEVGMAGDPPRATVYDKQIARYRVNAFQIEETLEDDASVKRATWRKNLVAAQGETLIYTVPGWYNEFGELWDINTKVRVVDALNGFDGEERLISALKFVIDKNNLHTELTVVPPQAYSLEELPLPSKYLI